MLPAGAALARPPACRGRYVWALNDSALPAASLATWSEPGGRAAGCPPVTTVAADVTKSRTCGTAASAPTATTAGAAFPAVRATLCAVEGAECRPLLLTFRFLRCAAALTNLPNAGTAPGYSANRASRRT